MTDGEDAWVHEVEHRSKDDSDRSRGVDVENESDEQIDDQSSDVDDPQVDLIITQQQPVNQNISFKICSTSSSSSPLIFVNHLDLQHFTTSARLWIPKILYKSSLCFPSFKDTPHIQLSISPLSVPSSLDYADSQPSLLMFKSHMSAHSGHKLCKSFPIWFPMSCQDGKSLQQDDE